MDDLINKLRKPFHPDKVDWRVGSTNKDKTKGMALAYIDSRTVMERLDEACGIEGWQCTYPHAGQKTSCRIGIHFVSENPNGTIRDEWIWKEDGAGDTDFEGEKGAFSDAFKRAAVKWGIGRYLYDLKAPWVAIEQRGRSYMIKGSEMPSLRALLGSGKRESDQPVIGALNKTTLQKRLREFDADLRAVSDSGELAGLLQSYKDVLDQCRQDLPRWWDTQEGSDVLGIADRIAEKKAMFQRQEAMTQPVPGSKFEPEDLVKDDPARIMIP